MRTLNAWIVIRNADDLRLVRKRPVLAANEVAVQVIITAPTPPRIIGTVTVNLPEPPPAKATAQAIEYGEE